jgi:4-amino-4-deoxy-L-arabinose transferase-like glycosyltransferase
MIRDTQRPAAIHVDDAKAAARVLVAAPKTVSRKSIFLILFAALLVNAAVVLVGLPTVSRPLALTSGMTAWYSMNFGDLYDAIAKNLDEGNGYRVDASTGLTMLREPGYPLMLAAAFKLGGYGIEPARVVCVLLAFGTALLLVPLARKITGDAMVATAAALLFLLYPGTLVAEARAGVEIPSIFTVVLFMLVLYNAVEKGSLLRYCAAGLLLGMAVLVRSQALLFPLLLFVYLLIFASKSTSERVKIALRIAALGLGAVVVMSPWIIRNYRLVHKLVPTATVAGVAAQEGLYTCKNTSAVESFSIAQTEAGFERERFAKQLGIPSVGPYYQLFYTPQDEVAFNQALLSSVSTEYRSHPELLARCAAKNLFFNFWFLGKSQQSAPLNVLVQVPLLGLALAGFVVLWKRSLLHKAGIVLLYILYIPVVQAPIIAHTRHSMLIVPFLAILGAVSLVSAWRGLRMHNSGAPERQTVAATSGE